MATQIQLRRDSASNWHTANPVLASGELAVELDTKKFKIGDGSTAYNDLVYATDFYDDSKIDAHDTSETAHTAIREQLSAIVSTLTEEGDPWVVE